MIFIKDLQDINKKDVNRAGGKGASLGEMIKAGIAVPPGFVVLSAAFEYFLCETGLNIEIDSILSLVNHQEVHTIERASEKIRALISQAKIPKDIESGIRLLFKNLDSKYVAVRSSATAEDSSSAAWAGQLESYLNTTEENLLENIKKCWASLFTPRAIFYRFENGLRGQKISVAVVVQKMVESEKSGIAFSVHPVTEDYNQLIIEAGLGLGEAIVSGSITPDSYVVEKEPRQIINKNIQVQNKGLYRADNNGNMWCEIDEDQGKKSVLSDKEILELSEIVLNIERHYGFPCDIEWAFEKDNFYIVQSRPITTLSRSRISDNAMNILNSIKDKNWSHYVSRKFSWFIENTEIIASQSPAQMKCFGFSVPTMNWLVLNGDEYSLESDFESFYSTFLGYFEKDRNFFEKFAKKEFDIVDETENYKAQLRARDFGNLTDKELVDCMVEFDEKYVDTFVSALVRPDSFLDFELKKRLGSELGLSKELVESVFSKIVTCPILGELAYCDEHLELLKIARQIIDKHEDVNNLSDAIDAKLDLHVDKYSWMKGPVALEYQHFVKQDYLDRLTFLVNEDVADKIKQIVLVRENDVKEYEKIKAKYKILGSLLKLCEAARTFVFLRTYTTEASDSLFYWGRWTLLKEIAKRLNVELDDLVMLIPGEIIEAIRGAKIDIAEIAAKRRKGFASIWEDGKVSVLFGEDATFLQVEINRMHRLSDSPCSFQNDDFVSGTIANHGLAQGRVIILRNYRDTYKVQKGDIIVASMTTPDFVSAMEKAAAFVTDEGGITCHAAILSREFGVPCIIGTVNGTQVLQDGQLVEVDANQGIVKILS